MDINCGTVLENKQTIQELGEHILDVIIDVASGTKSLSELNG